jgi:hypothetical protein
LPTNNNKETYLLCIMENIYSTNDEFDAFDFSKMELTKPIPVLGGNHFIKFLVKNGSQLYVQPPACISKQGIVKVGKKHYCDLMFTNENEHFIRWMENLEIHCHKYIYENRAKWFDNEMELHDIENYFTSPIKLYKSGKYYTIRANIQTILDKPKLKIYNEDGEEVEYSAITSTAQLMTIVEVQGIRCSARSFQIDMEIKQAMVLKPANLFDKCLFKQSATVGTSSGAVKSPEIREPVIVTNNQTDVVVDNMIMSEPLIEEQEQIATAPDLGIFVKTDENEPANASIPQSEPLPEPDGSATEPPKKEDKIENIGSDEMQEVVFHLDELPENDQITLKNRNDVYYEMYREARRKAKYARELALASYLEAKNIKNKYMLDDIGDSDESDESGESDLENDDENEYTK